MKACKLSSSGGIMSWLRAVAPLALGLFATRLTPAQAQNPTESFAVPNNGPTPLALGTTRGERYHRLIIRGAIVLSGRGTPGSNRAMPPEGPVDLVIENGMIVNMVPMDPVNAAGYGRGFQRPTGDRIIDARGMYVMPGLVEMHAHLPRPDTRYGPRSFEYAFRLYLGHGITAVRDAGSDAGIDLLLAARKQIDANQIPGPKLVLCLRWPQPLRHWDEGNTPDKARAMVRQFKAMGADCIKISKSPGHYPDVLEAAVDEGKKLGMFTMVDLKVSETDARVASNAGVKSIEHWYGIPDAALSGSQNFPTDYNYWNELDRFRYAGLLWSEADKNPEKLSGVIDLLIKNGTNWDPTMTVYEDNRDWWRRAGLPVQETLMHPNEVAAGPDSSSHGAFKTEWKTSDEINWKRNFAIWMRWVKTFHERGGLLTTGSDEGGIGGIMLIRELELLQEAGIHPIDVIKVATSNAYSVLGWKDSCGVRVGCRADLAVVNGNPLDNFKVMYGRGYGFYGLVARAEQWKHGGVAWTIKDGIVFDAQALLREAEGYVEQEKARLKGKAVTSEGPRSRP
jgi:imidazolonepropionase-like amidohydrolase